MKSSKVFNWLLDHRHPIFLVGLIIFFILPELFDKIFHIVLPGPILLLVLVLSSIFLIHASAKKRNLIVVLIAALLVFIFIWNRYREYNDLTRAAYITLFIYFLFITYYLFKDLLRSRKVTGSVIIGAFAGYFMIGVMYFFIYASLDNAYPDTINVNMQSKSGLEDMFYFSFITLTTIGYGDFAPTSTLGQKVAILEGLTGQFYLAIIMAILVGKFLSTDTTA